MENPKENVLFTNWTNKDFSYTWNKEWWTFKAGESVWLFKYLADHFAKHLVVEHINGLNDAARKLARKNREEDPQEIPTKGDFQRELERRCFGDNEKESTSAGKSDLKLEIEILNKNKKLQEKNAPFCDKCDSKGVRHKKDCPTLKIAEIEFPDLNK